MALTATATIQTQRAICKTLRMVNPAIVTELPSKPNIKYIIQRDPGSFEETFAPLVEEVKRFRHLTDKTIIFCHSYDSCSKIYLFLKNQLGKEFTDPIGAPDLAMFCLVDMFLECTYKEVKDTIIEEFTIPTSRLRIVVANHCFWNGYRCTEC